MAQDCSRKREQTCKSPISTPSSTQSVNVQQSNVLRPQNETIATNTATGRSPSTLLPSPSTSDTPVAPPPGSTLTTSLPSIATHFGNYTVHKTELPTEQICRQFMRGKCSQGKQCKLDHPPRHEWHRYLPKIDKPCIGYQRGQCFLGENCQYRHPAEPSDMVPSESIPLKTRPVSSSSEKENAEKLSSPKQKKKRCTVPSNPKEGLGTSSSTNVLQTTQNDSSTLNRKKVQPGNQETSTKAKPIISSSDKGPSIDVSTRLLQKDQNTKQRRRYPVKNVRDSSSDGTVNQTSSIPMSSSSNLAGEATTSSSNFDQVSTKSDECRDFRHGRCTRVSCKYRHVATSATVENHVDRLVGLLNKSVEPEKPKVQPWPTDHPKFQTPAVQSALEGRPLPKPIPLLPPGLGLEVGSDAPASKSGSDLPESFSVSVLDSVQVTFGPGFEIRDLQTGFESRKVFIRNIPANIDLSTVKEILVPFGDIRDIQFLEQGGKVCTKTVRATFGKYTQAAEAVSALNGAHIFEANISVQLASYKSTSLGKGTVHDGDVYLEFPAPCRTGFAGYPTTALAQQAISRAHGTELRGSWISAAIYNGIPRLSAVNVKFYGLPPDAQAKDIRLFGENEGFMFKDANYTSLQSALHKLQHVLERSGELISLNIIAPPYIRQTVRAWAHFTSPIAAARACRELNTCRQYFVGNNRVYAHHVWSVSYTLPAEVFDAISEDIHRLRSCVCASDNRCNLIISDRRRYIPSTPTVSVKVLADHLPMLTRLKTSFESILRGERVVQDGSTVWDPFFDRPAGIAFLNGLQKSHGLLVNRDPRRRTLALFGPPRRRANARKVILEKVAQLHAQRFHKFPLDGRLIGLFVSADLMKLQEELGRENVVLDFAGRTLKVRGNDDARQVVEIILRRAKQRYMPEKKRPQHECPICFCEASLPVTLDCGHSWCKVCLTNYLLASVDTKVFPLTCLGNEARCSHPVPLSITRDILDPRDFTSVSRASFLAYIQSKPSEFHYCPTPDCEQVYRSAPPDTVLQCPSCLVRICGNCHVEFHEGSRCPTRESDDERLFEQWTQSHDVKNCPGCKVPIERAEGCNHVTCIRCKTHICWVCLSTFTKGEDVYDHMRNVHGGIGL
ncbi:hypothetical protein PHLCEN_2v8605 [Hermanssonia centrifuga]|uniref:RING-type E3 ubiquitin transferase n=1 Tax=Hermanssonia centrifuga TaxID=98765 RepID=A0A2R6NTB4_9APHY|nr:hypothetical protein PHLCEN_2v8605 [Hermanssonia centrifuga]